MIKNINNTSNCITGISCIDINKNNYNTEGSLNLWSENNCVILPNTINTISGKAFTSGNITVNSNAKIITMETLKEEIEIVKKQNDEITSKLDKLIKLLDEKNLIPINIEI